MSSQMRRAGRAAAVVGLVAAATVVAPIGATAATPAPQRVSAKGTAYCNYDEAAEYSANDSWLRLPFYYNAVSAYESPSCTMGLHSSGVAVKALQTALNRCYHAGLVVDGIFGSGTQSKLESAQRSAGVSADGVYGPHTRDAIKWGTDKGSCVRFASLTY